MAKFAWSHIVVKGSSNNRQKAVFHLLFRETTKKGPHQLELWVVTDSQNPRRVEELDKQVRALIDYVEFLYNEPEPSPPAGPGRPIWAVTV